MQYIARHASDRRACRMRCTCPTASRIAGIARGFWILQEDHVSADSTTLAELNE